MTALERRNRNILIFLTAVVIVTAVFSSFGLQLFAGPTPTITLPTPPPPEQSQQGSVGDSGGTRVEVTPATVQSVIAALDRLESYSRTVTTVLEGKETTAQVWVDGGWTRSELTLPTGLVVHTIVGDGAVWRWYDSDRTSVTWAADDSSMDVEGQRLPTYEDVLALDQETIVAAGYEEKNGTACVYVEVSVPELAQTERYWVSSTTGLLTAAETESGGEVVWTMRADSPEIPAPVSASFALPDGTVLHTVGSREAAPRSQEALLIR